MSIITPGDLGTWLGITDTEDDSVLATAAAAACERVTAYCDREFVKTALVSASAREFFGQGYCVEVDDFWETTALVVKYDSTNSGSYSQTLTRNTDYILEPLNGRLNGRDWPYTTIRLLSSAGVYVAPYYRPNFQVTAAWGWSAIPDAVKQATLIEAAAIYHRKSSPSGVVGGFADFSPFRVSRFDDPDVEKELLQYRKSDPALYVG